MPLEDLDLDINNYSLDELYQLFGLTDVSLTEKIMKTAKKRVLCMHPDKSKLTSEYFIFFSKAYNKLLSIYTAQNIEAKQSTVKTYSDNENNILLDNFFEKNKSFKEPNEFNNWFNNKFNKHYIKEDDTGYNEWMKSNEGIIPINNKNLSQHNFNSQFEKQTHKESVVPYKGLENNVAYSSVNNTSSGIDIMEAYTNTIITNNKQNNLETFIDAETCKTHRNADKMLTPLSEKKAMKMLNVNNVQLQKESAELAFGQRSHMDKQQEKLNLFWSDFKQLQN